MKFLLVTDGTWGDTLPFMFLAQELMRRGHDAHVFSNEYYANYAHEQNIPFTATTSLVHRKDFLSHPELWHPQKGMRVIGSYTNTMFETTYPILEAYLLRHPEEKLHIVAHTFSYAAKTLVEKYSSRTPRILYSTLLISPLQLRSAYRLPVQYGGKDINHAPHFIKKLTYPLVDRFILDPNFDKHINVSRKNLGLKPIRSFVHWATFGHQSICLWPEWYSPFMPDQKEFGRHAGFPTSVEIASAHNNTEQDVVSWIHEDPTNQPILVTMGSGYNFPDKLLESLTTVASITSHRFILVGPDYSKKYASTPSIRICDHVEFSKIIPLTQAVIHHGGAGTLAQTITHGKPHIVVPMSHDQPDNAAHIKHAGLGNIIWNRTPPPYELQKALEETLTSPDIAARCASVQNLVRESSDGIVHAAEILISSSENRSTRD